MSRLQLGLFILVALVCCHWLSAGPSEIVERPVDLTTVTP